MRTKSVEIVRTAAATVHSTSPTETTLLQPRGAGHARRATRSSSAGSYYRLAAHPTLLKRSRLRARAPDADLDGDTVVSGERVEVVAHRRGEKRLRVPGLRGPQARRTGGRPATERPPDVRARAEIRCRGTARRRPGTPGLPRPQPLDLPGAEDRKVALFIDKLPQGVWEIRYELRAEIPGASTLCRRWATRCTSPRSAATAPSCESTSRIATDQDRLSRTTRSNSDGV